jgi:hypothetical protein
MSGSAPSGVQPRAVVLTQLRKPKRGEAVFRVVIILVLLASLALAWWAFAVKFVPLQKQSRDLTMAVSRLSTEVDALERKWTKEEAAEIRARYKELHTQLFADTAALQAWLSRLEEMAAPLSLQATVEFGNTVPQLTNDYKVAFIPANVSLEVRPVLNSTESPYQRLLRLGQKLAVEGKRSDLAELTVSGGPMSITKAQLVFNLWAGEEAVETSAAGQNGGVKQ